MTPQWAADAANDVQHALYGKRIGPGLWDESVQIVAAIIARHAAQANAEREGAVGLLIGALDSIANRNAAWPAGDAIATAREALKAYYALPPNPQDDAGREGAVQRLVDAVEAMRTTVHGNHSAHWDDTMQHGAGCTQCHAERAAMDELRQALAAYRSLPPQDAATAEREALLRRAVGVCEGLLAAYTSAMSSEFDFPSSTWMEREGNADNDVIAARAILADAERLGITGDVE